MLKTCQPYSFYSQNNIEKKKFMKFPQQEDLLLFLRESLPICFGFSAPGFPSVALLPNLLGNNQSLPSPRFETPAAPMQRTVRRQTRWGPEVRKDGDLVWLMVVNPSPTNSHKQLSLEDSEVTQPTTKMNRLYLFHWDCGCGIHPP